MAKRHNDGEYGLVQGRKEMIVSTVYTLNFDDADGANVVIKPERLHAGEDAKGDYLYQKKVTVPCIADGATDENIGELIQQFADDLRQYDAAQTIVGQVTNEKGEVTGEVRGERWLSLCTNGMSGDKEAPVSAGQYIAELLGEAHRLRIQKRVYKPLREAATEHFRDLDGVAAPTAKVRAKKAQVGKAQADVL